MKDRPDGFSRRAATFHASDDISSNPTVAAGRPTIGDIINARYSRRGVLKGLLGTAALSSLAGCVKGAFPKRPKVVMPSFGFEGIEHGIDETHHVSPGYSADILIRWGDPIHATAPEFDPHNQSAAAQEQQFGYNNDFLGFVPLDARQGEEVRGLLCVNHEYTSEEVMFPQIGRQDVQQTFLDAPFVDMTADLVAIEQAAHGGTVVEVVKKNGKWQYLRGSPYNRRITARSTQCTISGPAAGHHRLKTGPDPTGTRVIGTIGNCAGGITPWATYLMAEENFNGYFTGELPRGNKEAVNYKRYGVPAIWFGWGLFEDRFDLSKEPNEPNRFGWVVEVDPMDPTSVPKKRTALGRFKHEGASTAVSKDGRIVIYMGDDQSYDYIYKFVTAGTYDREDRAANMDLLDEGTLFTARFNTDGTLDWLPLIHGEASLTAKNDFNSQADVLIEVRRAADLLDATPMDRPEDIEADPRTGKVYAMLTGNSDRRRGDENAANPRADNVSGHIIEISEPDGDFAATRSNWGVLVLCGDPSKAEAGALWHPDSGEDGWFAAPDNCAIDGQGRLWVATDQGRRWSQTGSSDGLYALETEGPARGAAKMLYRVPVGAELCGPCFTPDDRTLFVSVQHPATDGVERYEPFGRVSTFEDPATRWPDFNPNVPPRPSVVAITKKDRGVIGS